MTCPGRRNKPVFLVAWQQKYQSMRQPQKAHFEKRHARDLKEKLLPKGKQSYGMVWYHLTIWCYGGTTIRYIWHFARKIIPQKRKSSQ